MEHLTEKVEELIVSLGSHPLFGEGALPITNYIMFMTIAMTLTLLFFLIAARRVSLVPKGVANVAEWGVEFVRNGICSEIIGPGGTKYFPFVGSLFFFILFNNILGLIPAFKPGTGTMGVTVALAVITFVYYTYLGLKKNGLVRYLGSFSPPGVPFPINVLVWVIEVFSNVLRMFTLSVRLFANMFAGHIVLGAFALLIGIFAEQAIHALPSFGAIGSGLASFAFLAIMIALYALEVFVAFIQAYVFTVLTAVYINMAVHVDH